MEAHGKRREEQPEVEEKKCDGTPKKKNRSSCYQNNPKKSYSFAASNIAHGGSWQLPRRAVGGDKERKLEKKSKKKFTKAKNTHKILPYLLLLASNIARGGPWQTPRRAVRRRGGEKQWKPPKKEKQGRKISFILMQIFSQNMLTHPPQTT